MKNKVLLSLLLSAIGTYSACVSADEWSYQLEPYLMVTSIKGDATIGRTNTADVDVDFGTILDNLDAAAMVHFEAHHDSGWGVMFDYGFMDLGGDKTNDNGNSTDVSVRQGVLELHALYRNKLNDGFLDYFAGVRWWDNDIDVTLDFAIRPEKNFEKEVEADWIDPVIGVRWIKNIDDKWMFLAQADVGGFGLGSDFTSSVQSGVMYKISDLMTLDLKYKATWVDYEEGRAGQDGYFGYDTVTHGTVIGLAFNF
ncbi:outer membrane beta-barrel protein [Colwellia psychrerythraea]|uniref:Outer membrane protein beta-barrel domain-containing protein n=1 Tax=Colwellia psychrerythraea (strain 34H / ATCC BAA-681) TaxID=167879 RepID=Q47U50_COLP3|nr:outer membrane beta-barrel protein [Colwellia psychrerythraea]AAZ25736.1 hypothetical protein CPS_5034 [Colwellia psychrerythraea 34H]